MISIVDKSGNPVSGASVVAQWSGPATDLDSGTTSGGDVQFDSDTVSNSQAGQFTVTVTDVSATGFVYDPAANVETADCIYTAGATCTVGPPGHRNAGRSRFSDGGAGSRLGLARLGR